MTKEQKPPLAALAFPSRIYLVCVCPRPVNSLAAACTSAICHYALLTETPRSASASLSFTFASFALAFDFSVLPAVFEVITEETATEFPLLQKTFVPGRSWRK